jgi:hypothetical protein
MILRKPVVGWLMIVRADTVRVVTLRVRSTVSLTTSRRRRTRRESLPNQEQMMSAAFVSTTIFFSSHEGNTLPLRVLALYASREVEWRW